MASPSRTGARAAPRRSGAGKSTLTAALLGLGWRYLSDEALCLAPSGAGAAVRPYPRPLALDAAALALRGRPEPVPADGGELLLTASELGAAATLEPSVVTDLVLLQPAGRVGVSGLSRSAGLEALIRFSFTISATRRRPSASPPR